MVATHQITVAEFEAMPLEGHWELIDGELVEMSPAAGDSGWIAGELFGRLRDHVRAHNLGWVFGDGVGFVLFADRAIVRSPDAAFVRGERLAKPPRSFIPLAPDLAVEVLSPTDRMADALAKVAMYLQAGVRLVWLVNPATNTVIVFSPDAEPRTLHGDDTLDGGEVLPGFSVPDAELFL